MLKRSLGIEAGSVLQSTSGDAAQVEVDALDIGIQSHESNDGAPEVLTLIREKGAATDAKVVPFELLTKTPVVSPEDAMEEDAGPRLEEKTRATEVTLADTPGLAGAHFVLPLQPEEPIVETGGQIPEKVGTEA